MAGLTLALVEDEARRELKGADGGYGQTWTDNPGGVAQRTW
jgi:hypothetical protein